MLLPIYFRKGTCKWKVTVPNWQDIWYKILTVNTLGPYAEINAELETLAPNLQTNHFTSYDQDQEKKPNVFPQPVVRCHCVFPIPTSQDRTLISLPLMACF